MRHRAGNWRPCQQVWAKEKDLCLLILSNKHNLSQNNVGIRVISEEFWPEYKIHTLHLPCPFPPPPLAADSERSCVERVIFLEKVGVPRNRDTDVENKRTPRGEGKGGMNWDIGIDIYTLICIK